MSKEAVDHFAKELDKLVTRARFEYDANYAEIIGVLTMKAGLLVIEADEDEKDANGEAVE